MFHLNPEIRKKGVKGILYDAISPQVYAASSIEDFLKNRDSIEPTSTFRALRHGFLGLNAGCLNLIDSALIAIVDQTYTGWPYHREKIEDETGYLHLRLHNSAEFYKDIRKQRINSGDRVEVAVLLYDKQHDYPELHCIIKSLEIASPQGSWLQNLAELNFSYQ
ncbi:MAG: hypothetical protein Q7K45_04185 [Nanoarchaeota archaeon]|nr:hypothetical protein [Nanoarchaeota archaeon]